VDLTIHVVSRRGEYYWIGYHSKSRIRAEWQKLMIKLVVKRVKKKIQKKYMAKAMNGYLAHQIQTIRSFQERMRSYKVDEKGHSKCTTQPAAGMAGVRSCPVAQVVVQHLTYVFGKTLVTTTTF
jgi:hypothetical protein